MYSRKSREQGAGAMGGRYEGVRVQLSVILAASGNPGKNRRIE